MPHPGRGLQPVPRARGLARLRPGRHREQDPAARGVRRRHLPGEGPAARALHAGRSERDVLDQRILQESLRQGRGGALRAFLRDRSAGLRQGGHRLGAREVFRTNMSERR